LHSSLIAPLSAARSRIVAFFSSDCSVL
jgi:hypothetical protein